MAIKIRPYIGSSFCSVCYTMATEPDSVYLKDHIPIATWAVWLEYRWLKHIFSFCQDDLRVVLCDRCKDVWIEQDKKSFSICKIWRGDVR